MGTQHDVPLTSWEHLATELFVDSLDPVIARHRSPYIFRGVSASDYGLHTSLQRLLGDVALLQHVIPWITPEKHERAMLRNFRKYAHRDASPGDSVWNWLSVAQHHGLPTRLLDWTFSPYVAAFFATDETDKFHLDAAIWCVHTGILRDTFPPRWRDALNEEHAWLFDVPMLDRLAPTLSEFDAEFTNSPVLVFFEPPSLDDRIVNQSAMFSVMSGPTSRIDEWLDAHPGSYRRLIIPSALKQEIRDKLDMMNLTERVIYPGLDGLAKWLKRHYSPDAAIKAYRAAQSSTTARIAADGSEPGRDATWSDPVRDTPTRDVPAAERSRP